MEYVKFDKMGLNNHVSLSHSNIPQRAHQWARFHTKKHLGVTLANILYHMCKSGQLYPYPRWVISIEIRRDGCQVDGLHMENHD